MTVLDRNNLKNDSSETDNSEKGQLRKGNIWKMTIPSRSNMNTRQLWKWTIYKITIPKRKQGYKNIWKMIILEKGKLGERKLGNKKGLFWKGLIWKKTTTKRKHLKTGNSGKRTNLKGNQKNDNPEKGTVNTIELFLTYSCIHRVHLESILHQQGFQQQQYTILYV